MPLIALPQNWAPGQIIPAAWGNNVGIDVSLLDARTGGDPPATNRFLVSTTPPQAGWRVLNAGDFGAGIIPDAAMSNQKVNQRNTDGAGNPGAYPSFAAAIAANSAFYDVSPSADGPNPSIGFQVFQNRHWNWAAGDYRVMFAMSFSHINECYLRIVNASVASPWARLWHSLNDGAGTDLDAGKFEGKTYAQAKADIIAAVPIPPGAAVEVPIGVIAMWMTSMTAPTGWVIETSMFNLLPAGVNATQNGTFGGLGSTGGAASHAHTVTAHAHDLSSHTHRLPTHVHGGPSHTHGMKNHGHNHDLSVGGASGSSTRLDGANPVSSTTHSHPLNGGIGTPTDNTSDAAGSGNTGLPGDYPAGGPNTADPSNNTSGNATPPTDGISHLPPFRTVLFIKKST